MKFVLSASGFASIAILVLGCTQAASALEAPPTDSANGAQVEEIVVTATRTGTTALQKTPIALTTFSPAQLERSDILGTHDLAQYTPDLQVAQTSVFAQLYIRGVGSNNTFNGSDPDVTVNIDGVYIARPFGQFTNFLDVERVEVLRGPQGTLYGRNAIGGTINIISRKPTDDYAAEIRLLAGAYAEGGFDGYVSGAAIAGKADFSVAGSYYRHDPYRQNIIPGGPNVDDANQGSLRTQLRLTPTDDLDATTRVDWEIADQATLGTSMLLQPFDAATDSILGNYRKVAIDGPNRDLTRGGGVAEDIVYTVNENLDIRSLTAFRIDDVGIVAATDGTDLGYQLSNVEEKAHQFSEDFTLRGHAGAFDYVAGLYYFNEGDRSTNDIVSSRVNLSGITDPTVNDYAYAAYANLSYRLTDALTLTVGDRYSIENKRISQYGGIFTAATGRNLDLPGPGIAPGGPSTYSLAQNYYGMAPKFGIEYQFTDDLMGYFSATRGWKSGGFNQGLLPTNSATVLAGFVPEKIWSFEGGVKSQWFARRLRFNVTGFHYDYTNLQVQSFLVPGQTSITNAAIATIDGVEFETEVKPVSQLDLGLNLSVLDAKYQSYPNATATPTTTVDASGRYLNEAPPLSMNMWAQYGWVLADSSHLWLRGEYAWQDREYFTAVNDDIQTQGPYGLVNFLAGWDSSDDKWRAELYVKNAFDRQYITQSASFPAVPAGHAGPPQTYGASLTWHL